MLDDETDAVVCRAAAQQVVRAGLDVYYWIEVGRCPSLADAQPRWMASLGAHDDWRARFADVPPPKSGEVAKAYPWVPIGYQAAFDAHLTRVRRLLELAAEPYAGVLLNDLQGGPASCGCGNVLCRWALDYHVSRTAQTVDDPQSAAVRFVQQVQQTLPGRAVIPVWTTECEDADLPADGTRGSTGLCGSVPCARGECPKQFRAQLQTLTAGHAGPIGLLALDHELQRNSLAAEESWVGQSVAYLLTASPDPSRPAVQRDRLWVVVQGYDVTEAQRRKLEQDAAHCHPAVVLTALARIDQSYMPKVIPVEAGP